MKRKSDPEIDVTKFERHQTFAYDPESIGFLSRNIVGCQLWYTDENGKPVYQRECDCDSCLDLSCGNNCSEFKERRPQ